jgi:hypothetical protein
MTSGYNKERFINNAWSIHRGEDYGSPIGTPIYTNQKMTVIEAREMTGYGNAVMARDENGYVHTFGHLANQGTLVRPGQTINPGDKIAYTGNTGDRTTGPHLHYDIRKSSLKSPGNSEGYVDPKSINPATGRPFNETVGFEPGKGLPQSQAKVDPSLGEDFFKAQIKKDKDSKEEEKTKTTATGQKVATGNKSQQTTPVNNDTRAAAAEATNRLIQRVTNPRHEMHDSSQEGS